jgi:tellurite resistance protein TehA-like permease
MSIGPYGFTAAGIGTISNPMLRISKMESKKKRPAQLGSQADLLVPETFLGTPHVADIIKVISILVSLWLWGLAMWFFLVCVGALWKYSLAGHHMPFQMTWWSFVFPNTALVSSP